MSWDDATQRALLARAASLSECLSRPAQASADLALAHARWQGWAKALGADGSARRQSRLVALGLSAEAAQHRLGAPAAPPDSLAPLQDTLGEPGEPAALRAALVRAARVWLAVPQRAALLAPTAAADLLASLDTQLAHVLAATGRVEGDAAAFWQAWPVAARCVARVAARWRDNTAQLLARWTADRAALSAWSGGALGAITRIDTDLSDPHAGGATVCRLHLGAGTRLVYKPRAVALDAAWSGLLDWLAARGLEGAPPVPRTLARAGHAWVAQVDPAPCDTPAQLAQALRAWGVLLCLAHLLGATDLHDGNVVATRAGPVLLDMETLLQPHLVEAPEGVVQQDAARAAVARMQASVLRTGLLPSLATGADGRWADTGTLGALFGAVASSDYTPEQPAHPISPRLEARLQQDGLDVQVLADALETGFRHAWSVVVRHRAALCAADGPLSAFRGLEIRVLLRDTRLYLRLLRQSLGAQALRDGVARSLVFEPLHRITFTHAVGPALRGAVAQEIAALEALEVPLLAARTDADALVAPDGASRGRVFVRSGWDDLHARLQAMDAQEEAWQCRLIRGSLAARAAGPTRWPLRRADASPAGGAPVPHGAVGSAEVPAQLLALLDAQAVCGDDGSLTWIAPLRSADGVAWRLGALPADLPHGALGVAWFAAVCAARGIGPAGVGARLVHGSVAGLARRWTQITQAAAPSSIALWCGLARGLHGIAGQTGHAEAARLASAAADMPEVPAAAALLTSAREDAPRLLHTWLALGRQAEAVALARCMVAAWQEQPANATPWPAADLAAWAAALGAATPLAGEPCGELAALLLGRSLALDDSPAAAMRTTATAGHDAPLHLAWLACAQVLPTPALRTRLVDRLQAEAALPGLPALDGIQGGSCCLVDRLLTAADVLDWPAARTLAAARAGAVAARAQATGGFATLPAPVRHDGLPGLALGHAGIGLTFLRLAAPGLASWRDAP